MRKSRHAYDFTCPCIYMYDCIERGILKSKVYYVSRKFRLTFGFVPGYIYTIYLMFNIPTKLKLRRTTNMRFIRYLTLSIQHLTSYNPH